MVVWVIVGNGSEISTAQCVALERARSEKWVWLHVAAV
jgi:hypothetical protein